MKIGITSSLYLYFDLIERVVTFRPTFDIDHTTKLGTGLRSNLVQTLNNLLVPTEFELRPLDL